MMMSVTAATDIFGKGGGDRLKAVGGASPHQITSLAASTKAVNAR